MTVGLNLGAPGVYRSPERAPFAFSPIRLDIAGFVGVALRGPVNTPVRVDSWTDYQRAFGAFEEPDGFVVQRLLPYGVKTFFAQGGIQAYVVRVAPAGPHTGDDEEADAATAQFQLGPYALSAADEGAWGNRLIVELGFDVLSSITVTCDPIGLQLPRGSDVPVGSLVRLRGDGLPPEGVLRWVEGTVPDPSGSFHAVLDIAVPPAAEIDCAVVTGTLSIDDGDETVHRAEVFDNLGLDPRHPRFLYSKSSGDSAESTVASSRLIHPRGVWDQRCGPLNGLLDSVSAIRAGDGSDRLSQINFDSFFDESAGADPLDEWTRHRGVDAMGRQSDVGVLCVPDLDWQWQDASAASPPWKSRQPTSGEFESCATTPEVNAVAPVVQQTRLDPRDATQLEQITRRQQRVVDVATLRRRFIALLDVPNGIPMPAVLRWRARFDSSFAAAYHPWLGIPREDIPARTIIDVPPSAIAAGIIAARENRYGLPWGPANELGVGVVAARAAISDAEHDRLHLSGINVFRVERDGFRLSAARTLSSDPDYRQLSIRRLMTMLELTIDRQAQWLVFEPNTVALRRDLSFTLTQLLRDLQRGGAFAGATDAESFFVRCDDELNPRSSQELGRLVAEVGVAPAAPLEYLVLRITQDQAGRLQVAPPGGRGGVS
jgi:hypothetical protein